MTRATGLTFAIMVIAFVGDYSFKEPLFEGQILIPAQSKIDPTRASTIWLVVDKIPEDYILYWEIQRLDGALAIEEFAQPQGQIWMPRGGGVVNLKLEITPRGREAAVLGPHYRLKVRETRGRLESITTVVMDMSKTQSASL